MLLPKRQKAPSIVMHLAPVHWPSCLVLLVLVGRMATLGFTAEPTLTDQFQMQELTTDLQVGYAVKSVDINGDGRLDLAVVDKFRVVWFENPDWQMHVILDGVTKPDNVCFGFEDIDGDGRVDMALGADWTQNTQAGGTIQWLRQRPFGPWEWRLIGEEPTVHRLLWANVDQDPARELVILPLFGRNSTRPHFAESGVRILAYDVPPDPLQDRWPVQVLNEDLHVAHGFSAVDLDADAREELVVASFEGVSWLRPPANGKESSSAANPPAAWHLSRLGAGNQATSPNRGSSEVKLGELGPAGPYLATIEPWHGNQVVVYLPPEGSLKPAGQVQAPSPPSDQAGQELLDPQWRRFVLDEKLAWGHAVACANLDQDPALELIVGVRDQLSPVHPSGVRIYDPVVPAAPPSSPDAVSPTWVAHRLDPGGVAVEDLIAVDLDQNGAVDIVAVGRATHNLRIYWARRGK